jgi:hypothetical protein
MARGATSAHPGKDRLDHRDGSVEVGGEEPLDVVVVAFLDGGAVAVAGVVDQDVDPAEALLSLGDGRGDLRGVGDVERQRERGVGVGVGEVLDLGRVACGDDDIQATVKRCVGQRAAEAGRAAGDEPCG